MSLLLRGTPFPYRRNSLNLFRLILAATVLFAHSFYITGHGHGPMIHGENFGGWAVAGFFVLSGFLITRSRLRTGAGEYLLHRVARIFPAFVVCLLVTAFLFAPLAALLEHGTLRGFFTTATTPFEYIWGNIALYIHYYDISTTLQSVPYPHAWNGSLWTLFYEFLSYIVLWVLGSLAVFRKGPWLAALAYLFSLALWIAQPLAQHAGLDASFALFTKLLPYFLGGSFVYFVVERSGVNALLGIVSLVITGGLILGVPDWGGQASAPFLAYGLLWLSSVIPQPGWIARNDVSYGFYIYAWPVQQLVVLLGGIALGLPVYIAVTIVVTFTLAWLSWRLIERRVMRIARATSPTQPLAAARP